MAWQLIYTSAPRLLEAGRSGFGTVARHRAIHPILAAALERDSQFDRSAVRGRVVFAHRIVAAGGSRFHVLSCIRETGADYTGRTNHIAHHLIIDPRELSALGSAAPTPVDICRGMTWRTAWPDAPKWLEGGDEIALAQFSCDSTPGGAWQAIAGDARYAGILRPATSSALLVPPDADALALFAESLTVAASQAWQATFTNCIQPTDDLSEFRWVAVEAASPARERASGGRTVLDLTAPESLPAPPESRSKLFIPAPDAFLPAPSSLAPKAASPVGNLFDAQLAAHAPRTKQQHQKKKGLFVYIALAAVLAGAAVYCGMTLLAEAPELTEQRKKIREEVNATFPGTGPETAKALSEVSKERLAAALAVAKAGRQAHEALQKQPLPQINIDIEAVREKARAVSLNIPPPIGRIFDSYSTHPEFQQRREIPSEAAPAASQLGKLASLSKEVDQSTVPQVKQLPERAMKSVELPRAERAPPETPKQENVAAAFEGDLIIVMNPTKPEDWEEFAKELAEGNYKLHIEGKPLHEYGTGKFRYDTTKEALFSFNKKDILFQAAEVAQKLPYELELKRNEKTDLTAWVPQVGQPFRPIEGGLVRAGNEIQVKNELAKSLCKLAHKHEWAPTLASVNWSQAIPIDGHGNASITSITEKVKELNDKIQILTDQMKQIDDGNKFPVSLKNAIADMVKYAGEAGFPTPQKDEDIRKQYKDEKEKANLEKALAENERLRNAVKRPSPDSPVSFGYFLQLVSNRPVNSDALSNIGKEMEKERHKMGSKKFADCIASALSEIRTSNKTLTARTQIVAYSNDKERQQRERDRNEAKRDLEKVQRLEAFLVAIQALSETRKTAESGVHMAQKEIDSWQKHPLLHPELLPGKYTISVKPRLSDQPIPFIHFTISKPQ